MPSVPNTAILAAERKLRATSVEDLPARALQSCTAAPAPHIWTVPDASAFILMRLALSLSVCLCALALASNTYIYVCLCACAFTRPQH